MVDRDWEQRSAFPTQKPVLTYLEQRASEPCAPSVLRRTRAALAFYEEAAGLPTTARVSKCTWFGKQADALESTLCGTKKGQAWQTHSAYIAAAEALVVERCLESWAQGPLASGLPCDGRSFQSSVDPNQNHGS